MTPGLQEEIARAIAKAEGYAYFSGDEHYDGIALAIAPIIARLVEAEREACAEVADVQAARQIFEDRRGFYKATARDIAAAIRARKPQP